MVLNFYYGWTNGTTSASSRYFRVISFLPILLRFWFAFFWNELLDSLFSCSFGWVLGIIWRLRLDISNVSNQHLLQILPRLQGVVVVIKFAFHCLCWLSFDICWEERITIFPITFVFILQSIQNNNRIHRLPKFLQSALVLNHPLLKFTNIGQLEVAGFTYWIRRVSGMSELQRKFMKIWPRTRWRSRNLPQFAWACRTSFWRFVWFWTLLILTVRMKQSSTGNCLCDWTTRHPYLAHIKLLAKSCAYESKWKQTATAFREFFVHGGNFWMFRQNLCWVE